MQKRRLLALMTALWMVLAILAPVPVGADDLAQAKAAGLVGEQLDGYLGVVRPDTSSNIRALVSSINRQRRSEYERIAAKHGVSTEQVAQIAAQKLIQQTPAGQYVQTPSGWQRR